MSEKTAIDWLVEQIIAPYANIERKENLFVLTPTMSKELFEKAKQMEKEQIIDARQDGVDVVFKGYSISNEEYYNETYGGDK
jgi:uncharacterized protein YjcR